MPSNHVRDRIITRYLPLVRDALDEIVGAGRAVDIVVVAAARAVGHDRASHAPARRRANGVDSTGRRRPALLDEAGLNPRYTFETFVKGASNQFALAAALRVAETPARSYNPLFIYGSAGPRQDPPAARDRALRPPELPALRGALRLHRDVPQRVRRRHPHQHHATFKRRYRDIDVLLIDDIQFMEGKEGLQEEFFHTFNSLHGANKQIVISSDRMPDAIPTLEERLRGRFKWGLITDIQPPDLETRLAILRNKAERDQVEVPAETARVHRHQHHHEHP